MSDDTQGKQKFSINFDLYRCNVLYEAGAPLDFAIAPYESNKVFKFRAESEYDAVSWVGAISEKVTNSRGYIEKAIAPQVEEWWTQDQMTE